MVHSMVTALPASPKKITKLQMKPCNYWSNSWSKGGQITTVTFCRTLRYTGTYAMTWMKQRAWYSRETNSLSPHQFAMTCSISFTKVIWASRNAKQEQSSTGLACQMISTRKHSNVPRVPHTEAEIRKNLW